jgi:endonuclease/exonuclease/phosphatase family metal-dependent hydrolase
MNVLRFTPAIALLAVLICASGCRATVANPPLCVMTFNLRFASPNKPNSWPERRPVMRATIESVAPDLIGTQEGLHAQLGDIAADLPDFAWTGVGRDDGVTKGEFAAVFYRKSRLETLATNHFWLSGTPEIPGSATWGNKARRMVTWLKFRDRQTGQEFFLFNTHFDHLVQFAREESAKLIRKRVTELDTKLPVLVIGDFNAAAETNQVYHILTGENFMQDAWTMTTNRIGDGLRTYNEFKPDILPGPRIDWILTRGAVTVERAEVVTFSRNGQWPSDHFPVAAWLRLGK